MDCFLVVGLKESMYKVNGMTDDLLEMTFNIPKAVCLQNVGILQAKMSIVRFRNVNTHIY